MTSIADVRLLGDQIIVRCLGTANRIGLIWVPLSAQEARKIHQSGGDYLHRGEVLKIGPGDKMIKVRCSGCLHPTERITTAKNWDCELCGSPLEPLYPNYVHPEVISNYNLDWAEMPVKVGDTILYENRRDAKLHPGRFPSLDFDGDELVVLLAEQHVLAVLEEAA